MQGFFSLYYMKPCLHIYHRKGRRGFYFFSPTPLFSFFSPPSPLLVKPCLSCSSHTQQGEGRFQVLLLSEILPCPPTLPCPALPFMFLPYTIGRKEVSGFLPLLVKPCPLYPFHIPSVLYRTCQQGLLWAQLQANSLLPGRLSWAVPDYFFAGQWSQLAAMSLQIHHTNRIKKG